MKLLKKVLSSTLLAVALTFSFNAVTAHAAVATYPCSYHGVYMHFNRSETGVVTINSGVHPIYNSNVAPVSGNYYEVNYFANEVFYYDEVYTYYNCSNETMYYFASYRLSNGVRRFVLTSYENSVSGHRWVSGITIR